MTIKIKDKEYCLDGYGSSETLKKALDECYQQGRLSAIEECIKFVNDYDSVIGKWLSERYLSS